MASEQTSLMLRLWTLVYIKYWFRTAYTFWASFSAFVITACSDISYMLLAESSVYR